MREIFSGTNNLLANASGKLFVNCATVSPKIHVEVERLSEAAGASSLHGWQPWWHPVRRAHWEWRKRSGRPTIIPYEEAEVEVAPPRRPGIRSHPCLLPNWDNSPRSAWNGLVLHKSTPELFRRQLRRCIAMISDDRAEERLLFVKSWNEWAEGNHLEPDLKFGRGYLDVIREELQG
jgi:hypothetical protein